MGDATEAHRRQCEARDWLRKGYTTVVQVDELMHRIAERRGHAEANSLREEMRRQWSTRRQWLGAG
ncbi:hypothetical protein ACFOLC_00170 [Lysobacter cavernae]|uniref:CopG family transcriptional regulator n=1 Tax=Lysobacter cavernae TaxID=1685901 RepID=A0ABV7RIG2_9GAMM